MRTLVVERRFTPRCRPYGDQPALGGARDGGDRGHDVASGGCSTWPGESRAGSSPITARFAAYQEGHVAAIAAGVGEYRAGPSPERPGFAGFQEALVTANAVGVPMSSSVCFAIRHNDAATS